MTEAAQRKPVPKPARRLPLSAPVLWLGMALGTFLAVVAVTHGVMLPGLNGFLAAVLTFVLILAVGVALVELARRHHRAVARHGWRHGKRGGAAAVGWSRRAARGAAVRSRPWRTRIVTAVRARWAARGAPAAPEPEDPAGELTALTARVAAGRSPRTASARPARPPGTPAAGSGHRPDLLVGSCGQPVRLAGG